MTDLSHWDFAKDFSGPEAAALIVDIEPGAEVATTYQHQKLARNNRVKISPVINRMKDCYAQAWFHYEYLLSPITNKPRSCEPDALHSAEMQRLFNRTIPGNLKTEEAFDMWMADEDQAAFENQRFTRSELSRWLCAIGMKSAYLFCGQALSEELAASPLEKPLETRERAGLLNIIGCLNELVQTPRPDREGDAAIIRELLQNYSDKYGVSKSNLEKQFAAAKRSLKAD